MEYIEAGGRHVTFTEDGQVLEGVLRSYTYIELTHGPCKKYTLDTVDGETVTFLGTVLIDEALQQIAMGTSVYIQYQGLSGRMKKFKIGYDSTAVLLPPLPDSAYQGLLVQTSGDGKVV